MWQELLCRVEMIVGLQSQCISNEVCNSCTSCNSCNSCITCNSCVICINCIACISCIAMLRGAAAWHEGVDEPGAPVVHSLLWPTGPSCFEGTHELLIQTPPDVS